MDWRTWTPDKLALKTSCDQYAVNKPNNAHLYPKPYSLWSLETQPATLIGCYPTFDAAKTAADGLTAE